MLEPSRHTKMDEEVAATLEREDQILATAANVGDALSLQRGRDRLRRLGTSEAAVQDGNVLDTATCQRGREPGSNRLHFRELGHGKATLAARSCPV